MDEPDLIDDPGNATGADAAELEQSDADLDDAEPPLAPGDSDLADAWWAL